MRRVFWIVIELAVGLVLWSADPTWFKPYIPLVLFVLAGLLTYQIVTIDRIKQAVAKFASRLTPQWRQAMYLFAGIIGAVVFAIYWYGIMELTQRPMQPGPQSVITDREVQRRGEVLRRLRQEYILSHDDLSPGMIAGTGPLPQDWLERRLREMGETWEPKAEQSEQQPSKAQPAQKPPLLVHQWSLSRRTRMASVTINTAALAQYAKDFSVLLVMRVADNSVEVLTDNRIEKSPAFTITGEVRKIEVNLSKEFIERADATNQRFNEVSFQYYVVVVPRQIRPEQIVTLSDVTALGGKLITEK